MNFEEQWLTITGFDKYEVSNLGRVRSVTRPNGLKSTQNNQGFPIVVLYGNDSKTRYVRHLNKLVADAFVPKSEDPDLEEHKYVWHYDGNLNNCEALNLKWADRGSVLEWNKMHRLGVSEYHYGAIRSNRTGVIYASPYDLGVSEGYTESSVIIKAELLKNATYAPYTFLADL